MRVLYVATDLRDADILQQEVKRAAPKLTFDVCGGLSEARGRLEKTLVYDVMLLDSSMPEADQLQLVQHLRGKQIPLPVVVLAGQGVSPSSTLVSAVDECISRGPRLAERLAPGLRMAIERYRVVSTTTRENERLKRSEGRLRLIIEALPAGVVLVDHAGKILAMNLAGAALVGVAGPSDVVGRELYSLADAGGAQALRDLVSRALTGERSKAEFTCHGPDGENRHLVFDGLCIQREDAGHGSVLGVLAAATAAAVGAGSGDAAEDASVEFAFGADPAAFAEERLALEQELENLRADAARIQGEAGAERGRLQEALSELERARATAAEHHAQRAEIERRWQDAEAYGAEVDRRCQEAESRLAEVDQRYHEAESATQGLTERVDQLAGELASLREERERIAREADGLREELLEQRRQRLALEETVGGLEGEQQRLHALTVSQSALGTRVAELEAELEAARTSAVALETDYGARLDAERSAAAAEVAELTTQLQALQSAAATATAAETTLAAELDRLRIEATQLTARLEDEGRARERAALDADQVRAELEASLAMRTGERDELERRKSGLEAAQEAAHEEEMRLRAELTREAAERARVERALDERLEEMAVLATQGEVREALEGRVADLERQLADAQRDHTTLTEDRAGLALAHTALEQRLAAAEERLADAQRDHTALTQDRAELALARTSLEERLAVAEGRLAVAEERLADGQAELGELDARTADLDTRLAAAQQQLEERQARLQELETHASDLETRRQEAVARIAELEESRRNEQGALADATRREAELGDDLRLSREEAARVAGEREAARADLARERDSRAALEDAQRSLEAEGARLRAELDAKLAARQADIDRLARERDTHAQELADAHAAIERTETSLDALRSEMEAGAQREAVLASELESLQEERNTRGRQAFELEHLVARERAERADLASRLEATERDAADARMRAEVSAAQMQRDHEEVVARLQKLLEQAAAREFQAAAAASTRPSAQERGRRRPADRIGQLASAMANDLHVIVKEMAEESRRLLAELPEGSTVRAKAEHSVQSANRAGELVRHLLRLSEREARATSGVETSGIVRANEPMLRQLAGPDIDLRFELGAGLPPVECDTEDVVQVLSTLVVTVRGALPLGGTIRVLTQERTRTDGRRRSDSALGLSVVAEGYGMVPVPTTVCEEVITRCGGTFKALVEPGQSTTTLTALLPIDATAGESVSNIA